MSDYYASNASFRVTFISFYVEDAIGCHISHISVVMIYMISNV